MTEENKVERDTSKLTFKLVLLTLGSFAFCFALVPLYDVFCDVTGLNGKTGGQVMVEEGDDSVVADEGRLITVQFLAMNNEGAPIKFGPKTRSVKVHPGEVTTVEYYATNLTDHEITSQSVPSVSPLESVDYVKKMECFCFQQQTVGVGETKDMPLRFYIDKELPEGISKVTLNYTIFDITEPSKSELTQMDHSQHGGSHHES